MNIEYPVTKLNTYALNDEELEKIIDTNISEKCIYNPEDEDDYVSSSYLYSCVIDDIADLIYNQLDDQIKPSITQFDLFFKNDIEYYNRRKIQNMIIKYCRKNNIVLGF